MPKIIFQPIGEVSAPAANPYESPRQGSLTGGSRAVIRLYNGFGYEQALEDMDGIERIWVIYTFHLNDNWKPKVAPPYRTGTKKGVFSTRAPYRPNPVGLSCVRLLRIEGLNLYIDESDMLDGSPVLDIKPYLPYADSFPGSSAGWADQPEGIKYKIIFSGEAEIRMQWLLVNGGIDIRKFARIQLEYNPDDQKKKRIEKKMPDGSLYVLSYRTWRISYQLDHAGSSINIISVDSGYSDAELSDTGSYDKYGDLSLHRSFRTQFKE